MTQVDLIPAGWSDDDFVSPRDIAAALGLSTKTLDNWTAAKRFPRPVLLGPRTRRYQVGAVRRALRKRERAKNGSAKEGGGRDGSEARPQEAARPRQGCLTQRPRKADSHQGRLAQRPTRRTGPALPQRFGGRRS